MSTIGYNPMYGNEDYTSNPALTTNFAEINAGKGHINKLTVGGNINGLAKLRTYVGYTPTEFSTVSDETVRHIMTEPNLADTALNITKRLTLPTKQLPKQCKVVAIDPLVGTGTPIFTPTIPAFNRSVTYPVHCPFWLNTDAPLPY